MSDIRDELLMNPPKRNEFDLRVEAALEIQRLRQRQIQRDAMIERLRPWAMWARAAGGDPRLPALQRGDCMELIEPGQRP